MKRVFTILLATVLLLSFVGGVSAGTVTNATDSSQNKTTATVSLNLDDSYVITLPDTFSFGLSSGETHYTAKSEIEVVITRFDYSKRLNITVSGDSYYRDNLWNITDITDPSKNVSYYMSKAVESGTHIHLESNNIPTDESLTNLVASGDSVLVTNSSVSKWMHLKIPVLPSESGTYQETITFTVSLEQNPEIVP